MWEGFQLLDLGDLCSFTFIQKKKRPSFQDSFSHRLIPPTPSLKISIKTFLP